MGGGNHQEIPVVNPTKLDTFTIWMDIYKNATPTDPRRVVKNIFPWHAHLLQVTFMQTVSTYKKLEHVSTAGGKTSSTFIHIVMHHMQLHHPSQVPKSGNHIRK